MSVVRWNPFRELQTLQEDMNCLFTRSEGGLIGDRQSWLLPMDVIETQDALKLRASLPGVSPEDVNVHVQDHTLTVSAQRRFEEKVDKDNYVWIEQQYGSFNRTVTLPQTADTENIEARYENGVLELTVPKAAALQPRRIALKTGDNHPKMIEAETQTGAQA